MAELIASVPVANELGEGIIWDHRRQCVWWTDIEGQELFNYDPVSEKLRQWDTPERLACFAPVAGQDYFVAAFDKGFAFYQPETGAVDWIKEVETDNPGTRLNDGRTDRQGRFWAGTMVESSDKATYRGALYCLDAQLIITKHVEGLTITNSLCWSPNGERMYHCDTPSRKVQSYDFDINSGVVSNRETILKTARDCYPDGSCIDRKGKIWNAQWGGKKVVQYSPQGEHLNELEIPASQPSCTAFGGPDLNLLFVTSAWQGLSAEQRAQDPEAGNLFIYQTEHQGLNDAEFFVTKSLLPDW